MYNNKLIEAYHRGFNKASVEVKGASVRLEVFDEAFNLLTLPIDSDNHSRNSFRFIESD